MPNITKSVEVGAPVEKVFEMLDNPENFPVYVPNVTKVSNIRRSEKRLGDTFDVVYSMMGMEFPETFTYSEYTRQNYNLSAASGTILTGIILIFVFTYLYIVERDREPHA